MQDLDFLPLEYRQKHIRRQSQPWRVFVVLLFAGLLAAAAISQHQSRRRAQQLLASITPQYDLVLSQRSQLAGVQAKLQADRRCAELFTYLRHPWPRTQLLAAVLGPLPEEVNLQQVQIRRERPESQTPAGRRLRSEVEAEGQQDAKLPPAARDLKRLRDEFDGLQTVILISGKTDDGAALHRYVGRLGENHLFAKAELDSIQSAKGGDRRLLEFNATVVVRPGYGQPGGPTGLQEKPTAQTKRRANAAKPNEEPA